MPESTNQRSRRLQELKMLWKTRGGQNEVLGLMHRYLGKGETLQLGTSAVDVILNAEFGSVASDQTEETQIESKQ